MRKHTRGWRIALVVVAASLGLATACFGSNSPPPEPTPTISYSPATQAQIAFNEVPASLERALPEATFKPTQSLLGSYSGIVTFESVPGFEGGYQALLEENASPAHWKDLVKVATRQQKVSDLDAVLYDPTHDGHLRIYVHRVVSGQEYVASLSLDWPEGLPLGHDDALMKGAEVLAQALLRIPTK